jgi:hypothetical protein
VYETAIARTSFLTTKKKVEILKKDRCVTSSKRHKNIKQLIAIITTTITIYHKPKPINTMKTYQSIFVLFALALSTVNAFTITTTGSQAGSSFLISQRSSSATTVAPVRTGVSSLHMGGKQSKFGVFSPAVYGAKIVLGTDKLNKIRGKGISLHSQTIGEFCQWYVQYIVVQYS